MSAAPWGTAPHVAGLRSRGVVDSRLLLAGVSVQTGTGTTHGVYNIGAYEEVLIDTGAVNTDYYTGGVRVNFIPRDGGNVFSGTLLVAYADDSFAGDNITPELDAKGITSNTLEQFVDFMPTFGGPILQDRLWFHTAARYNRAWNFVPSRFNLNAGNAAVWTYEPGAPASNRNTIKDVNTRLTWQANATNKLAMTYDRSQLCDCPRSLTSRRAPEANVGNYAGPAPYKLLAGVDGPSQQPAACWRRTSCTWIRTSTGGKSTPTFRRARYR